MDAVYYEDENGIKYKSLLFISAYLIHKASVRLFQRKLQLNRDSPTLRDRRGVGLPKNVGLQKAGSIYVFNLICTI